MKITRAWAMPNKHTFLIKPIKEIVMKYYADSIWLDPFCGEHSPCDYDFKNDLSPDIDARFSLRGNEFMDLFYDNEVDGVLFDPPYSPRQISECYKGFGLKVTQQDTQNQWTKEKEEIARIIKPGGICISFSWNSNGIGKKRGFEIIEILLVAHGSAHNDTICTVERKL